MEKTAYEMRISDWSSDVCSSDLRCDAAFDKAAHDMPDPLVRPGNGHDDAAEDHRDDHRHQRDEEQEEENPPAIVLRQRPALPKRRDRIAFGAIRDDRRDPREPAPQIKSRERKSVG